MARGLSREFGGTPDPPLGVWFLVVFGPFWAFIRFLFFPFSLFYCDYLVGKGMSVGNLAH